ncbi:MAG: TVP38/TMEM64 family protein [Solirubrobacteraceae bacterium]
MIDHLRSFVEETGPFGPAVFVAAYAVLTVALVPGTIPSLAAGALFGPVWGSLLVVAGATTGAVGAFEVARRVGRQRTRRLVGERVLRADSWVQRRGVSGVIGLRLLPVVPFNALNYAFGLSSVRRRDHAVGTVIGIVPGTVALVALGDSITRPGSIGFVASVGAVAALVAASVVRSRRIARSVPSGG